MSLLSSRGADQHRDSRRRSRRELRAFYHLSRPKNISLVILHRDLMFAAEAGKRTRDD